MVVQLFQQQNACMDNSFFMISKHKICLFNRSNYCGGCNYDWFLNGVKVDCTQKVFGKNYG